MAIIVRPVTASDEQAWRQLFLDYIAFYKETVPESVIDLTWRRILAREDNMLGLVAETAAGDIVGIVNLVFHRSTWSHAWYCYLEDLYVSEDNRTAGVGRALIEATYSEADKRGATRTYWATQETNTMARKLYDKMGVLTEFVQYRR